MQALSLDTLSVNVATLYVHLSILGIIVEILRSQIMCRDCVSSERKDTHHQLAFLKECECHCYREMVDGQRDGVALL
jgi:hypothetical protein